MDRKVSAFQALNSTHEEVGDDKDFIIRYQKDGKDPNTDSSESESESTSNTYNYARQPQSLLPPLGSDFGDSRPKIRSVSSFSSFSSSDLVTFSSFDLENVSYFTDYVILKLRPNDKLLIKGNYRLSIDTGSIKLDSVVISPDSGIIEVNSSSLAALPVIYAHRDDVTIKISSWFDGSEKIGDLYPQLKRVYENESNGSMRRFDSYSFTPVMHTCGDFGTTIPYDWSKTLSSLSTECRSHRNSHVLMIGGKNSGKSTFLRLLLNKLVSSDSHECVQVMDLDPGQTEYSLPECISFTTHRKPIFGMHYPFRDDDSPQIQSFLGFNNPQIQPMNYMLQMRRLIGQVSDKYPLLINTPGWIKGFGVEIFKELTSNLHITHLLFFSNSERREDEQSVLGDLIFDNLIRISGFHIARDASVTRYSSVHLRNFKKLSYFHYDRINDVFDFNPLLSKSPYKISYSASDNLTELLRNPGISLVTLIDANRNINPDDTYECIEFQVVGIFLLTKEAFQILLTRLISQGKLLHTQRFPNLAVDCIDALGEVDMEFKGLGLVHSLNTDLELLNIYTPIDVAKLASQLRTLNYKLILIKGKPDFPVEEIYPQKIYQSSVPYLEQQETNPKVPYVTFNTNLGKGGKPVSVRRNIQRRNLH
ncbi:hypothetical protein FOA43_004675 [Brettanomyces nanus]|uniref:Polynucleotide 5'-hydroxyl-kinase GRC3 n=1 Tax=Eeniella nana TaxID=13502 RepID=A0A875RYC5_EENNA|nr:uncharacterized protein FOA43_004675 [Brettanomyces nanus]QPG77267.1 hypothetical protein FOA43_004675 [Brettanomyces nanus]